MFNQLCYERGAWGVTRKHAKNIVCYPVVIAFNALNAPGLSTLERQAVALEIASVNIGWMSPGRAAGARTVFETRRQPNRHDGRSD